MGVAAPGHDRTSHFVSQWTSETQVADTGPFNENLHRMCHAVTMHGSRINQAVGRRHACNDAMHVVVDFAACATYIAFSACTAGFDVVLT